MVMGPVQIYGNTESNINFSYLPIWYYQFQTVYTYNSNNTVLTLAKLQNKIFWTQSNW